MFATELYIASFLLGIVLIFQIVFFIRSKQECKNLASLFPSLKNDLGKSLLKIKLCAIDPDTKTIIKKTDTDNLNNLKFIDLISLEVNEEVSSSFHEILNSTNSYLKNNIDTSTDFNIMRDIAERIADSEEAKVSSRISLPLYIGLMGTFIGVIFGIVVIVLFGDGVSRSVITEDSIKTFLSGVFIAMLGSFLGLLLTTINNAYNLRNAKVDLDRNKNSYLNFLQTELFPKIDISFIKSLKEFKENLNIFNKEFSTNISDFKGTIPAITDNLKLQTDFIKNFKDIDIPRIANVNLKIFEKIDESATIFKSFNKYSTSINRSIIKSDDIFNKLTALLDRLANFESNINQIGELVSKSDENYVKIGEYITENLNTLKERYLLIQQFVDISDDKIKTISNEYISGIHKVSQKLEKEFENAFDFANQNNPFSKLNLLDDVNTNLINISHTLNHNNGKGNPESQLQNLMALLSQINTSIQNLKKSIKPSIFKPIQFFKYIFSRDI